MGALPSEPLGLADAAVTCFLLCLAFAAKASVPKWRRSWGWGKGPTYPISLFGHVGISLAFLMLALGLLVGYVGLHAHLAPIFVLGGFALFIATGILDCARQRRR